MIAGVLIDSGKMPNHFVGIRASFHIQRLRLPNMRKASMLGHSGTACPATTTSGRITSRTNCARDISPNTVPATRKPNISEFIF